MKAALRQKRRALRQRFAALQREARARVAAHPAVKKARRRRDTRRGLTLLALVLLVLLFARCRCEGPLPEPLPEPEVKTGKVEEKKPPAPVTRPQPLQGSIRTKPRGRYQPASVPRPGWLESFHLQVSARSSRLARCFDGADRPGALRWAAALNAKTGAVSDHEIEPLGAPSRFTAENSACVVAVLSDPPYRLDVPASEALPNRVGLVIEF